MNAVILARVSSQEQEIGHSIKAQVSRLSEYCERLGYPIIRTCELVESSTRGDRKEFYELIAFLKKQPKPIAFVADAVDRVQRSFKESILLDDLRHRGVEVHFMREGIVLNEETSPDKVMMWDFSALAAKAYVASLSANVRRSITWKINNGEWPSRFTVGYKSVPDPTRPGKNVGVVDEERAHYVTRIFDLYATGTYSVAGLAALMAKEGLTNSIPPFKPLTVSRLYRVLTDPFYYGEMRIKGQIRPHKYPPLTTRERFDTCQAVRGRYEKTPFKYQTKPYVFRGLIQCAYCGCSVSSDTKKGKYTYLCCTKRRGECRGLRVREEVILGQVRDLFKDLRIPPAALEKVRAALQAKHEDEQRFKTDAVEGLHTRYTELQRQLDLLLDLRLRSRITDEDYERKAKQLRDNQRETEVHLQEHTNGDENFGITASTLLELAARAADLFESSNTDEKRSLLGFVCSNLELKGRKLDYKLKRPFDAVLSAVRHSTWLPLVKAFRTTLRGEVLAMTAEMELVRRLLLPDAASGVA